MRNEMAARAILPSARLEEQQISAHDEIAFLRKEREQMEAQLTVMQNEIREARRIRREDLRESIKLHEQSIAELNRQVSVNNDEEREELAAAGDKFDQQLRANERLTRGARARLAELAGEPSKMLDG